MNTVLIRAMPIKWPREMFVLFLRIPQVSDHADISGPAEGDQEATFFPLLPVLFLVWSWAVRAAVPSRARAAGAAPAAGVPGWQVEGPCFFGEQQEHGDPGSTEAASLPPHSSRCFSGGDFTAH